MKQEEAIDYLQDPIGKREKHDEAIQMAINALKAQLSSCSEIPNSSDLINRQAVIDTSLEFFVEFLGGAFHENAQKELMARIQRLPSAQPETAKRIVGKSRDGMTMWYQCDMCNEPVDEKDTFCSGCGRRFVNG